MTNSIWENYLKAIYKLTQKNPDGGYTNDIAFEMNVKPSSVSEVLKKLSENLFINYTKYKAVTLTEKGKQIALKTIRKHRLWEVFLVEKLGYKWDEIHPMAEELEHIHFDDLTERLATFLGNPQFDPHGDPIPDSNGNMIVNKSIKLTAVKLGETVAMTGIDHDSAAFLRHLNRLGLTLGTKLTILEIVEFDKSMLVRMNDENEFYMSAEIASNILCR
ncbi:MAG: metal-dependent transcriptional regulator [Bacteroidota bacterium]|nr:metal-dependent transcriptional regulator [Bacteroidota bacterium]